jgi:hypothetical protein
MASELLKELLRTANPEDLALLSDHHPRTGHAHDADGTDNDPHSFGHHAAHALGELSEAASLFIVGRQAWGQVRRMKAKRAKAAGRDAATAPMAADPSPPATTTPASTSTETASAQRPAVLSYARRAVARHYAIADENDLELIFDEYDAAEAAWRFDFRTMAPGTYYVAVKSNGKQAVAVNFHHTIG